MFALIAAIASSARPLPGKAIAAIQAQVVRVAVAVVAVVVVVVGVVDTAPARVR